MAVYISSLFFFEQDHTFKYPEFIYHNSSARSNNYSYIFINTVT